LKGKESGEVKETISKPNWYDAQGFNR